jgi:hypothetical protein
LETQKETTKNIELEHIKEKADSPEIQNLLPEFTPYVNA